MSKHVIKIENLSFRYDKTDVLSNVSLSLDENSFTVFLGPNGGGKTTLIKCIMGILVPRKGFLKIFGQTPKISKNRFGYIPQRLEFDPMFPLSLFEFVQQGLLSELPWYGVWKRSSSKKTEEILKKFNLEGLKSQPIGGLSGGQLQKAIIARALVSNPDILIFDEPLSGLDFSSSKTIISLIDELAGKKTILLITHVISHLLKKADHVYLVEKGVCPLKDEALCKHMELGLFHSEEEGCSHE
jgi:zinc transport system ATP-binding protein